MENKKSICFVATVEFAVNSFLFYHLIELSKFYNITVITSHKNKNFLSSYKKNIKVINVNFVRRINIFYDPICFLQLVMIFWKNRFDAVSTITPKAGLLGMLASYITFIPMRVHCYTGQIWVTELGIRRILFRSVDKFINILSTHNIVDSKSQYNFLVDEFIIREDKSFVLGAGSICGVNVTKFKPSVKIRLSLRKKLKIPKSAFIFLFLGRLNKDKGVYDLIKAFKQANLDSCFLLFVGPDEEGIPSKFQHCNNIIFQGFSSSPQDFLASADILCLPSYREGFGNVVIEAAAAGIPSMVSNICGLSDTVVKNKTGLLHNVRDIDEISKLLKLTSKNKKLVKELGRAAMIRAVEEFNSDLMVNHWVKFYENVL